jgi:hypothetical protein
MYGISDPKELVDWASEADIKIPVDLHQLIVLGNEHKIFKSRIQFDEATRAYNEYQAGINRMVKELSDRIIRPLESEMPNTTNLE